MKEEFKAEHACLSIEVRGEMVEVKNKVVVEEYLDKVLVGGRRTRLLL